MASPTPRAVPVGRREGQELSDGSEPESIECARRGTREAEFDDWGGHVGGVDELFARSTFGLVGGHPDLTVGARLQRRRIATLAASGRPCRTAARAAGAAPW